MDFAVLTAAGKGVLLRKVFPAGWNWVRGPLSLIAVCKYSESFRFVATLSVRAPVSASVGPSIMILFVRLTVWLSIWLSNWLFVSVWLFNYRTKVPRKKKKMQNTDPASLLPRKRPKEYPCQARVLSKVFNIAWFPLTSFHAKKSLTGNWDLANNWSRYYKSDS